jgi:hypothetical protein
LDHLEISHGLDDHPLVSVTSLEDRLGHVDFAMDFLGISGFHRKQMEVFTQVMGALFSHPASIGHTILRDTSWRVVFWGFPCQVPCPKGPPENQG